MVMSFADHVRADSTGFDSGASTASLDSNPAEFAPQIPRKSGTGRRIVYSNRLQRVWVVNGDNATVRTFLVSGRRAVPRAGSYRVFSQSATSFSPDFPGVTFRFATRFAIGPTEETSDFMSPVALWQADANRRSTRHLSGQWLSTFGDGRRAFHFSMGKYRHICGRGALGQDS